MSEQLEIRPATRQGVKPLIGIYSESGCGKTYSSLLLARGFVGPTGKIVMVDTESGRGSLYADVLPGGYDVLELREPFSPSRYIEAIQAVENSGAQIAVIDSGSHEWEGLGGVTDSAMQVSMDRAARYSKPWDGIVQFGDWKNPKMEHAKMVGKMLQSPLPIIVCLRAKHKSHQVKGTQEMVDSGTIQAKDVGRSLVLKDDFCTPIQADDFIFEMMIHGEILPNHAFHLTKISHPALTDCFPKDAPITIQHGEALARWCSAPMAATKPIQVDPLRAHKAELWKMCAPFRGENKSWEVAQIQLQAWKIITKKVSELNQDEMEEAIKKLKIQLTEK